MLTTIIAATTLPVTLAEAKAHLHIDDDFDDGPLDMALRAAIEHVQKQTTIVLSATTFRETFGDWPTFVRGRPALTPTLDLSRAPVRDVVSVAYLDESGVEQPVAATNNWRWDRTDGGASIRFLSGFGYPNVWRDTDEPVIVEYEAGFDDPAGPTGTGDDPELKLPHMARIVVLMLAGHWFEHREAVAKEPTHPVVMAADAILADLKVYR